MIGVKWAAIDDSSVGWISTLFWCTALFLSEGDLLLIDFNRSNVLGTLLSFTLAAEKNISKFGWQFRAESNDDISYDLYLTPSPEAIIGLYEIVLQVCAEEESKSRKLKDKFYLIFNPWCEQDVVYLKGKFLLILGLLTFEW